MKRIFFIVLLSLLFAGQVSADMLIVAHDTPGVGTTLGGAFTVEVKEDPIGIYVKGQTFETFCLEMNETVTLIARTYWVELNSYATNGGKGGQDIFNLDDGGTGDSLDPLSAWIYTQWMTNLPIKVNDTLTIYHNDVGANIVQYALWDIEEEGNYSSFYNYGVDALINLAEMSDWDERNYIGNVRVMNLYQLAADGTHTVKSQDFMVMVPLPATILLGFIGLGVGGWKLRKSLK